MKINSLSAINFKRAIEITANSEPYGLQYDIRSKKSNPALHAVEMVKQKRPKMYNNEVFRKIRDFLCEQIGDCEKSKSVISRIIQGRLYIFTGLESDKAYLIIEEAKKATKNNPDKTFCKTKNMQRDKRLLDLIENGCNGKPHTRIDVTSEKGKIKEVKYSTMDYIDGSIKLHAKLLTLDS